MFGGTGERLLFHLRENKLFYMVMAATFLGGGLLAVAAVSTLPELQCKELALYLSDFFGFLNQEAADANLVFFTSLKNNLLDYLLLTLLSLTIIGTPFIGAFSAVKGFVNCFLVAFLFKVYGIRTLLFMLVGLLPHALLLVPCYLFYMLYAMRSTVSTAAFGAGGLRPRLLSLLSAGLVFWGLALCASLMQGYIEPMLLKLVSGMFLA